MASIGRENWEETAKSLWAPCRDGMTYAGVEREIRESSGSALGGSASPADDASMPDF